MHCLTVIYPTPDDPAHFKAHYEEKHLKLAARLPGMIAMHHAYPAAVSPGDVFCIFQAFFPDAATFGAAMNSEEGHEVSADVPNYSPKGAQVTHFATDLPVKETAGATS